MDKVELEKQREDSIRSKLDISSNSGKEFCSVTGLQLRENFPKIIFPKKINDLGIETPKNLRKEGSKFTDDESSDGSFIGLRVIGVDYSKRKRYRDIEKDIPRINDLGIETPKNLKEVGSQ